MDVIILLIVVLFEFAVYYIIKIKLLDNFEKMEKFRRYWYDRKLGRWGEYGGLGMNDVKDAKDFITWMVIFPVFGFITFMVFLSLFGW